MFTDSEREQIAINSIRYHLNAQRKTTWTDSYIKTTFPLAIKKLIEDSFDLEKNKPVGATSITEGNQSISYKDGIEMFVVTESVRAMLPKPFLMGW